VEPPREYPPAEAPAPPERSGAWTIPLLCAGIAVLACCLLIPAADENRRLVWEREKLKADLEQLERQVDVNEQFLKSVADDPTLLERLAQRQMKMVREGTSVLDLKEKGAHADMSPYLLLSVPPPPPIPEYKPIGGSFSEMCRHPRTRLYLIGGALLSIACGLILGDASNRAFGPSPRRS
jgi:hypothetical protein